MAGFELTTFFAYPIEDVFAYLSDPSRGVEIVGNILKCEKVTPGPPGVGTRYLETRQMGGQPTQAELIIRAFEPPKRVTIGSDAAGLTTNYHYTLSPESGGTRVRWECELQAVGLRRMLMPMLAGIMKMQDGEHLERAKAALEKTK